MPLLSERRPQTGVLLRAKRVCKRLFYCFISINCVQFDSSMLNNVRVPDFSHVFLYTISVEQKGVQVSLWASYRCLNTK